MFIVLRIGIRHLFAAALETELYLQVKVGGRFVERVLQTRRCDVGLAAALTGSQHQSYTYDDGNR